MKTFNATLLAALIAIPTVSFADGGAEPFVNIHSAATTSEVRAQLAGTRAGVNEIDAGLIVAVDAPKTRAQVLAELAEAKRIGAVQRGDVTLVVTPEQKAQIAAAGLRAINADRFASNNAAVAALIASPSVAQ
jgi:hypothetical protein